MKKNTRQFPNTLKHRFSFGNLADSHNVIAKPFTFDEIKKTPYDVF